jgi:hypothetical protein
VWLELTRLGFDASPVSQVVEVRAARDHLTAGLALPGIPQIVLRVGRAPSVPATPRRSFADIVDIAG